MTDLLADNRGGGGGRIGSWDGRLLRGMSGRGPGTNGSQPVDFSRAVGWVALFLVAIDGVNVLSALHDAHAAGRHLMAWKPVVAEASSGAGMLAGCGIIYLALRLAPPGRTAGWRLVCTHGLASLVFSGVHVAIMMGLRVLIYASRGLHYRPPLPADLLYEYRKDALAYAIIAGIFWLARPAKRGCAEAATTAFARDVADEPAEIEVGEEGRRLRVSVHSVLAVRAASNYVEHLLDDGRRPLTRGSLKSAEEALTEYGFVRTHRSWIVNRARVRRVEAVGSGDHRLELDTGVQAPLSRRWPAALAALLTPGGQSSDRLSP